MRWISVEMDVDLCDDGNRQIESLKEDTEDVPFTYTINGHEIQFDREEFCLITGLRFGVEFSDDHLHGHLDFKRRVWESHVDDSSIIGEMLIDKIGKEPKHNVPYWWLRLVDDRNMWEKAEPIRRLRPDAFEAKAEWWVSSRALFDGRICEPPQIPPVVRNDIYQRICMPGPMKAPVEVNEDFGLSDFSGVQNSEASESFFEGAQTTSRQIESLKEDTEDVPFTYTINGHEIQFDREEFCLITGLRFGVEFSDDHLHGHLDFKRRVWESHVDDSSIIGEMLIDKIGKEPKHNVPYWWLRLVDDRNMWEKAEPIRRLRPDAFEAKAEWWVSSRALFDGRICEPPQIPPVVRNDIYQRICMPGPMKAPVEVNEDFGLSDFSGVQNSEDAMLGGKRDTRLSKYLLSPYTCLPETSVAPKKRDNNNNRKMTRNDEISPFDHGKAGIDLNELLEDSVMVTSSSATDEYLSFHNVDPTKVKRG
nr:hypothetical protein [Tanacetum cinerariifolium]